MLVKAFEIYADRPCFVTKNKCLSYAGLLELGQSLIAGIGQERALVALVCALSVESIAAYVALLARGHVPLLIDSDLQLRDSIRLYQIYRPDWILDPTAGRLTSYGHGSTEVHPELGLLLSTSGSTGSPKLVRLSLTGLQANAEGISSFLGIGIEDRAMLNLPINYSYGMSVLNSHFLSGASICACPASVAQPEYWSELRDNQVTSISGVPFQYEALKRLGLMDKDLPHLRKAMQAGGRLRPELGLEFGRWAERTGRQFYIMYGQTEAGPRIAGLPPEYAATAPDAVGTAIPGVSIALLDQAGAEVKQGMPGEIRVSGPSVMLGYATCAADLALGDQTSRIHMTGDIGMFGDDGLLRIVGRRSNILKIYGKRIDIDEISVHISDMGYDVLCFGEDDKISILIERNSTYSNEIHIPLGELRTTLVRQLNLPSRAVEIRQCEPLTRPQNGKLSASAIQAAWVAAEDSL
jgi:long-chain acyl-CoA synthetase